MSDLRPTSSNIRCEQSFSSNSTTSPVSWLEHSARQGFAQAQGRLGWMFFTGEAGEKDLVKAYAWMSLGAFGGDQGSFGWKDRVKTQMTADELTQALQLAAQLWQNTKRPNFR